MVLSRPGYIEQHLRKGNILPEGETIKARR